MSDSFSGIAVALVQEADLLSLACLAQESGLGSWSTLDYQQELLNSQVIMLGAYRQEAKLLVGFFFGRIVADEGELLNLVVRAEYRRAGIGATLLSAGLAALKTRGIRSCWLEVRSQNLAAIRLYEKLGFCLIGKRQNYYLTPPDDALMMQWKGDLD